MRTTSADEFVDFVQNLDTDSKLNKAIRVFQNLRVSTDLEADQRDIHNRVHNGSGSITVASGDLLQPERIHNRIVFNVVRKGDLTPSNRSHDSENNSPSHSVAECVQLDSPEKDMDASSASECEDSEIAEPESRCEPKDHDDLVDESTQHS